MTAGATRRSRSALLVFAFLLVRGVAAAQTITEFPIPTAGSDPFGIAAGPDGAVWFTEFRGNKIGRIATAGVVSEFAIPTSNSASVDIAAGPDAALWFTEDLAGKVGRITIAGEITEFRTGAIAIGDSTVGIARGPDGNMWFTEWDAGQIGRITPAGVITLFTIPDIPMFRASPNDIVAGPDGALWFTEVNGNKIGRITTDGVITQFAISAVTSGPRDITAGPDGNLWFTVSIGAIGRITTTGVITEFPIPTAASSPAGITTGPDGNLWFTERAANKIGRITIDRAPALETRILPVVGSTPGANGTFFKTAVQLHNSMSSVISGRIAFHASGVTGSGSDPALSYSLLPEQTLSIADLLPAMERSGLGSADIEVTSGSVPVVTARVFNDAGASGTTGFTEEAMRSGEALRPGQSGVLLLPADLTRFRFNLGVRTLEGGASATLTLRDASGAIVLAVPRGLPATYHEQQSAAALLEVTTLPPGGSISISVSTGAAIFYGATVDNTTGDPSLQIARPSP